MSICELTRTAIQDLIPHRDPFLFLERASLESDKEISGQALWVKGHPILQGHFPQKPVVPGVCLIEAGAQLAGVLLCWKNKNLNEISGGLGVLAGVQRAKFMHILEPEQLLTLHCRFRALNSCAYWFKCDGKFCGISIFECELVIAQLPSNQGS